MLDQNKKDFSQYSNVVRKCKQAGIIIGIILIFAKVNQPDEHKKGIEDEIYELTQYLFAKEPKKNRYLYKINYQGQTAINNHRDMANQSLLELHEDILAKDTNSTTYLMRRLFRNYNFDTHAEEQYTEQRRSEEFEFLDAVMKTSTMKHTMGILEHKGYVSADPKLQMQLLHDLWFQQYTDIPGQNGSCSGFEHVFLADLTKQSAIGLHNWIYFHEQEKNGKLDYKGFIEKIDLSKNDQHLLAVGFSFHNISITYNTLLVGTSPELELSLYTIYFLMNMNKPCPIYFGTSTFLIITHSWKFQEKDILGLAYPVFDGEFRPHAVRNARNLSEICHASLKCMKCKKLHDMKNKLCFN